ncbi:RNA polymerase sigma-70 factor, ECF subfamily [Anaerocolumna jejuensis DSM 15929]|uniref:RNA polymerase sigma-70 factor, ECF subfamily n=1 Tax=Anaerocolumna jejuensis DSM 15929 TaxID=1121322 RepID=A0A1M6Z6L6_9FIRM|nr:sigma-70 family RNA polymerase sigma factor [Anaerocolumna jejuensis]SHL26114.1 RNA polymerase sigma-70 factor, ECF subfamily [Anaerocolumna jejuensis DSM 15929]
MDKQDLEQVYKENAAVVYKYLFCLTHDANLTEELTQETFYQATKGIHKFRGECKISVWLCQIGKRLWYRELQKRKHQIVPIDAIEEMESNQNFEAQYIQNIDKVELFKRLHQLDDKTREVMYLRLTGELSFSEIGEILEKNENWARVTFYRGKQKIMKGRT